MNFAELSHIFDLHVCERCGLDTNNKVGWLWICKPCKAELSKIMVLKVVT